MKKQITILIIALGFLTAAVTFTSFITSNDVTSCESCGESHCVQKAVPVSRMPLVVR